jgi:hypothetical protein
MRRTTWRLRVAAAWGHEYVQGEPADEVIGKPEHLLCLLN